MGEKCHGSQQQTTFPSIEPVHIKTINDAQGLSFGVPNIRSGHVKTLKQNQIISVRRYLIDTETFQVSVNVL